VTRVILVALKWTVFGIMTHCASDDRAKTAFSLFFQTTLHEFMLARALNEIKARRGSKHEIKKKAVRCSPHAQRKNFSTIF
jgi:hypothetical protein